MAKTAILFSAYEWNDDIAKKYDKLKSEAGDAYDVFVNFNDDKQRCPEIPGACTYNLKKCGEYGFKTHTYAATRENMPFWHNFEYSWMIFYLEHPHYDYYWTIEYDVWFNGSWSVFFSAFDGKNDDFITNHILSENLNGWKENWVFRNSVTLTTLDIGKDKYMRCFNPIYRLSSRAIAYLIQKNGEGNHGYVELYLATVLNAGGFSVKQMGGSKNAYTYDDICFVIGDSQDAPIQKLIDPSVPESSVTYARPGKSAKKGMQKNVLYHPVR